MIRLNAVVASDHLGSDFSWETVPEWVLRYECFLGDVTFKIDNVDFSTHWGWVPVLDFALGLSSALGGLESGAGSAGGREVVVFVAKKGKYQGKVLTAVVPDATQIEKWGLR